MLSGVTNHPFVDEKVFITKIRFPIGIYKLFKLNSSESGEVGGLAQFLNVTAHMCAEPQKVFIV